MTAVTGIRGLRRDRPGQKHLGSPEVVGPLAQGLFESIGSGRQTSSAWVAHTACGAWAQDTRVLARVARWHRCQNSDGDEGTETDHRRPHERVLPHEQTQRRAQEETSMQCKATNRQGKRCGRHAIAGGFVCNLHGGNAPQVKAKAQLRLMALVDPSITRLNEIITKSKHHPSVVSACKDILDRAGFRPADKLQLQAAVQVLEAK